MKYDTWLWCALIWTTSSTMGFISENWPAFWAGLNSVFLCLLLRGALKEKADLENQLSIK